MINNKKIKIIRENSTGYYRLDDIYKILELKKNLKSIEIKKIEEIDYVDHYQLLKLLHRHNINKELYNLFLQAIYDSNYFIHTGIVNLNVLNKSCIYLLKLKNNEFKYGKSDDIQTTLSNYKTDFKKYKIAPKIYKIWSCNKNTATNGVEEINFFIKESTLIDTVYIDKYDKSKVIKLECIDKLIYMIDNYVNSITYNDYEISKLKYKIEEMEKLKDEYVRTIEILKKSKGIKKIQQDNIIIISDDLYKCDCGTVLQYKGKKAHEKCGKHLKYIKAHTIEYNINPSING